VLGGRQVSAPLILGGFGEYGLGLQRNQP
jgi:hypothetical protein